MSLATWLAATTISAMLAASTPGTSYAQKHKDRSEESDSYPAHVLIVRHAEKPPDSSPSVDLDSVGRSRAKALVQLFTKSARRPDPFPKPDFIFATRDTKRSHRPSETAEPLGAALGLDVDTRFGDEHTKRLAKEILHHRKYAGKTVLIVWHQGTIPDLAKALGAKDAPGSWKDSIFDRVWELSYGDDGKVSFENRPQRLLSGDKTR